MLAESIFRISFWILFGGSILMQDKFSFRVQGAGERVGVDRGAIAWDGWGYIIVRIIGSLALVTFLVLYAINPPWLRVLCVPFPGWLRWAGIFLGVASFGLCAWARAALGKEWSPYLPIQQEHHMVTSGPYACIRHPIYAAYLFFMTAIALVTASWFFVGLLAVSIVVFALRIPKEELMLIEVFGAQYAEYMRRTGGLLPRL
jgi:protein-S-isoprenylcysteine O-methyltransferase Ste14